MRLDFNILWVEDQPKEVQAHLTRIRFLLRKHGFKVHAEFATSVAQAETYLANDIYGDHIDLILMDYDLGNGPDGGAGIELVREKFPFKDIVFYSASGLQDLQQALPVEKVQGIFWSTRVDLADAVLGVFQALVKKVLDIDHSRGLVMGASSEIDHFVNESLLGAFEQSDAKQRSAALQIVAEQLAEIRKSFEKEAKKIEAATKLSELFDVHQTYTSAHRLRLLRKVLEARGTHGETIKAMLAYAKDVIPKRNGLAHVRVVRVGFSRKLYDRAGAEITSDDMQALRVSLLDHHEVFEKTADSLKPPAAK